jgi:hypothetical protein
MVFTPTENPFKTAYQGLSDKDKTRIKITVQTIFEISEATFYRWLSNPEEISKGARFHIANLFGKDSAELFKPKN